MPIQSMATVQHRIKKSLYNDRYTDAQLDALALLNDNDVDPDIMKLVGAEALDEDQTVVLSQIIQKDPKISLHVMQYISKPEFSSDKMQELYDRTALLKDCADNGVSMNVIKILAEPDLDKEQAITMCNLAQQDDGITPKQWHYLSTPRFDAGAVSMLYKAMKDGLQIYELQNVTESTNDDGEIQAYIDAFKSGCYPEHVFAMTKRGINISEYPVSDTELEENRGLDKYQIPEVAKGYKDHLPEEVIYAYAPTGKEAIEHGRYDTDQMEELRSYAVKQISKHSLWNVDIKDETAQFYTPEHGALPEEIAEIPGLGIDPTDPEHEFSLNGKTISDSGKIVLYNDGSVELMTEEEFWSAANKTVKNNVICPAEYSPTDMCLETMKPLFDIKLGANQMKLIAQCIDHGYTDDQISKIKKEWFPQYDDAQVGVILTAYNTPGFPEEALKVLSNPRLKAEQMTWIKDDAMPSQAKQSKSQSSWQTQKSHGSSQKISKAKMDQQQIDVKDIDPNEDAGNMLDGYSIEDYLDF